ncbi:ADP-ribosylglycohydrolase family protein [Methanobrevibacter sp.]|uniref:ADP-ribosylglycohydrolase family protein n=1 Tax=Methanobrevibacter sp. TaxID=66852 RepID=UPI0026DF0E39|nr:ADP-ribosylglycohydrolase family protein [Methanobrevibacter sp.]MDO5860001.1 ADP-ribosylglycohydrolase family protein [Methanobrevibacter sp.]
MKVKDGIIGLLIGDALGVPVEFKSREYLQEHPVTTMMGHGTYNMPKGTWSDDSSMTIATMASIVNKKAIDYDDIISEFCEWIYNGKYVQYYVFDYGNTTGDALYNYHHKHMPALESGCSGERDNGNGSLMRILPLAYIPNIDYETIENISGLTHAHKRSKIACVLYIEIAKSMIENDDLSIDEHIKRASDKIIKYYKGSEELKHFKRIFDDDLDDILTIKSGGYVIDTFESVIYCLKNTGNYKDAVLKAVNLGKDTDTVAAICGGLAGIYYGFDEIPIDWIDSIPEIEQVLSLCEKFEAFCDED